MTFWAYMLHCRGGAYYVGHSDDLDHRLAQHQTGAIPGFTADRLPVTLVWCQEFPSRIEALEAEGRIKGWSRAKKMALIRGDWDRISILAKSKNGPSTSSGRTGRDEAMPQTPNAVRPEPVEACPERLQGSRRGLSFSLIPHPDTPPEHVKHVRVEFIAGGDDLLITYHVDGAEYVRWPEWLSPARRDGLWQSTCFELFIQTVGRKSYYEFNFSPSTEWAAYSFDAYRQGMSNLDLAIDPHISRGEVGTGPETKVDLELDFLADFPNKVALSAVIEEIDGTKSYWALAHPPGKPDFHHPDCFALTLEAPDAA